jgi:hypothetical protein
MSLSGSTLDPVSFERIGWYQRGYLHAAVLGFVSLLFVGCAVGSLIPALVRAVRRKNRALHPQVVLKGRAAWQVAVLVGVLAGMAPVSVVLLLMIHTGEDKAAQGLRVALSVGLTFLVTGAITGASLVPLTVRAWRNRYWSLGHRLYYTALAIGWLVSIPLLVHYRLLGYWISL